MPAFLLHPKLNANKSWFLSGIWVLYCWLSVLGVLADESDYSIQSWTMKDGLPSHRIHAIIQSPDGYIWLGTDTGIARFDGRSFVSFKRADRECLGSNEIRQLGWSSDSDSLVVLSGDDHLSFPLLSSDPNKAAWIHPHSVLRMEQSLDKELFFLDEEGFGYMSLFESSKYEPFTHAKMVRVSMDSWTDLAMDSSGRCWLTDGHQLFLSDGASVEKISIEHLWKSDDPSHFIFHLYPSLNDGVWVVTDEHIIRVNAAGETTELEISKLWLAKPPISSVLEGKEGVTWVASREQGLYGFEADGDVSLFTEQYGMLSNQILCMYLDREGLLWVGTEDAGLIQIRRRFIRPFHMELPEETAALKGIAEDWSNDVYFAFDDGGILRFEGEQTEAVEVPEASWSTMYLDQNRWLWGGTTHGKLHLIRAHPNEGQRIFPQRLNPILEGEIRIVMEDDHDRLWIGTQGGLYGFTMPEHHHISLPPLFSNLAVTSLECSDEGTLWVGTEEQGVFEYKNQTVTQYERKNGLSENHVHALKWDSRGGLWIGTQGGGLALLWDGILSSVRNMHGLPGDTILWIKEELGKNLWIGLPQGVAKANLESLYSLDSREVNRFAPWRLFSQAEGMEGFTLLKPVLYSGLDQCWISTSDGVRLFDPGQTTMTTTHPLLQFQTGLLDGEEVWNNLFQEKALLSGAHGLEWEIAPGVRRVQVTFATLGMRTPHSFSYVYRMDSSSGAWESLGRDEQIDFRNLAVGHHRLEIRSINPDGLSPAEPMVLNLYLKPHFWQRTWVKWSGFGLLLMSAIGWVRWRMQRKVEHLETRFNIVKERERIANDMHDDLGARLTQISLLSELAKRETEDKGVLPEQLDQLANKARTALASLDEIVWAVNPKHDDWQSFVDYLQDASREACRLAGIELKWKITSSPQEPAMSGVMRHQLFLIVREALTNVVKHANATTVWLELDSSSKHDSMSLVIRDDGKGFDVEAAKDSGNGLTTLCTRAADLGADIEIQSTSRAGTTIRVQCHSFKPPGT